MKDISTVINEPDINSLYSHISQYLQDLSMYNDEKGMRVIYNVCKAQANMVELNSILQQKNLDSFAESIIGLIEKRGDVEEFIEQVKTPIHIDQLSKESNIYRFIKNPRYIDFWKKIANNNGIEGGKGVGKFELLLILLMNNAKKSNVGDVQIDNNIIELKGEDARCNPGGAIQYPYVIDKKLNELLDTDSELSILHRQDIIKGTWKYCNDNGIELTPEVLGEAMIEQWRLVLKDDYTFTKLVWISFLKTIQIDQNNCGTVMQRLYGLLSIYCYNLVKNFNYLLCMNDKGEYIMINSFHYLPRNVILKTLTELYNNKKLNVVGLPRYNDNIAIVPQINCGPRTSKKK